MLCMQATDMPTRHTRVPLAVSMGHYSNTACPNRSLHYQHNNPVPEKSSSHEKPSQVSKPNKPLPIRRHVLCNAVPNHWPTSWPVVVLQQQQAGSATMSRCKLAILGTSFDGETYTYSSCSSAFSCKLCFPCC